MTKTGCWMIALTAGLFLTQAVWAEQTNYAIGGTGAQELRVGVGARPAAMGGAFVGMADDANAVYWNPAGLARLRSLQVNALHHLYLVDTSCDIVTFAQPWSQSTGVGGAVTYYNFGTMDRLDETGKADSTFSPMSLLAVAGYGHRILPGLSWGCGLKYLYEKVDSEQYSTIGLDLGVQWQAPWELQTGLVVQNLGTPIADADLSRQVKLGMARAIPASMRTGDTWQAALDLTLPLADVKYTSVHLGTEYWVQDLLALRLGYQIKDYVNLAGTIGISGGLGFKYSIYRLDYSLVSFGDLGLTHQVALGVQL